jgi:hypothetical protein
VRDEGAGASIRAFRPSHWMNPAGVRPECASGQLVGCQVAHWVDKRLNPPAEGAPHDPGGLSITTREGARLRGTSPRIATGAPATHQAQPA